MPMTGETDKAAIGTICEAIDEAATLAYCLKIGWSSSDLPKLEAVWWRLHDEHG